MQDGGNLAARIAGSQVARLAHLAIECAAAVQSEQHPAVRSLLTMARELAGVQQAVEAGVRAALDVPLAGDRVESLATSARA